MTKMFATCGSGVYATVPRPSLPGMRLDLCYLGVSNPHAVFNQGAARGEAQTVGTRFFGTLGHWDVHDEAIYQFGQFGSGALNAWSAAIDHGYTLRNLWSAHVSVKGWYREQR